jgi:hypothetical protein
VVLSRARSTVDGPSLTTSRNRSAQWRGRPCPHRGELGDTSHPVDVRPRCSGSGAPPASGPPRQHFFDACTPTRPFAGIGRTARLASDRRLRRRNWPTMPVSRRCCATGDRCRGSPRASRLRRRRAPTKCGSPANREDGALRRKHFRPHCRDVLREYRAPVDEPSNDTSWVPSSDTTVASCCSGSTMG